MRNFLLVTVSVVLSGCLGIGQQAKVAPPVEAPVVASGCYTVDLFTKVKVEKSTPDVPEANRQFLGEWGGGAWNDVWCNGILVNKVYADGRADLVEMHAPYPPWNQPATAFRRTARIDDKGNLRFAYGTERLSYRIEDGKLVGNRSGMLGNLTVELARVDGAPIPARLTQAQTPNSVRLSNIPAPNPARVSQLGLVAKAGS
jgi:hypothetical protein